MPLKRKEETMKKKGKVNVRTQYYQTILAGWSDIAQPKNQDGDGTKGEQATPQTPPYQWEQKAHQLLIPVQLKQVGIHGNEYEYQLRIPTNLDVSVSPIGSSGKVLAQHSGSLVKATSRDTTKVSMVFRVSEDGEITLSPTSKHPLQSMLAYVFSRILEQVSRTVECSIQHTNRQETPVDDAGKRQETALERTNVRELTPPGRGKKIRPKIRAEAIPEETTQVAQVDG